MNTDLFDTYECVGQMSIDDILVPDIPGKVFAVSDVFARARKQMNLPELKAFTYTLTHIQYTGENPNKLHLDKKTLAQIVGVNSDPDHLSADLRRSIGNLTKNSFVEFEDMDRDFYENGFLITGMRMYRNMVSITFNPDYMALFQHLEKDYITMWSSDIFQMKSERSIAFYEELRLHSDTRGINERGFGVKALKELFNIPKDGKGAYMRKDGHFNRPEFEKKVIDPLVEDLLKCRMINLVVNEDGSYYEKVKQGNRVLGYRFRWVVTDRPTIGTAKEMEEVQKEIEKDPQILKIAKDVVAHKKKPAKEKAAKYKARRGMEHEYTDDEMAELEKMLLDKSRKDW